MENILVVAVGQEQGRDEVGSADINGSVKEFLCGDGTDLYLACGGGFTNLFMG